MKESFKMIDTDNTGQITFEKLKVGLKKFGAILTESEIFDLMQAVSINSKIIVNSLNVTQQQHYYYYYNNPFVPILLLIVGRY